MLLTSSATPQTQRTTAQEILDDDLEHMSDREAEERGEKCDFFWIIDED